MKQKKQFPLRLSAHSSGNRSLMYYQIFHRRRLHSRQMPLKKTAFEILNAFYSASEAAPVRQSCIECLVLYAGISKATAYRYYNDFIKMQN